MRQFNVRLILWLAGIFVVAAGAIHLLHGYQVRKNSFAFLEMARKSEASLREMAEKQLGTQKQLEEAVRQTILYYQRYLGLQRDDDLAVRIEYAKFLLDIGDVQRAYGQHERILRATIEDDPELLAKQQKVREIQIDLARMYREYADGIYHVNKLLESRPRDPKLLEIRGVYQMLQQDTSANNEAARKSFQQAIEYAPDYLSAYAQLAGLYRERFKNRGLAGETIDQMVTANPDSAEALVRRAQFLLADKDPAVQARIKQNELLNNAIADCEKAIELEPKKLDALYELSICHERRAGLLTQPEESQEQAADYAKALELLKEVIALKPDQPQLYLRWSNLIIKSQAAANSPVSQQRAAAILALREGIQAVGAPRTFDLRFRLADLLLGDSTRRQEADDLIKQLRAEQPENGVLAFLEAQQLMADQKWRAAAKLLEDNREALQKNDELANRTNLMLGNCYAQLADPDLNLEVASQVVAQDPLNVEARISRAEALLALGRLNEALQEYEVIKGMRRGSLPILKRYAELLLNDTLRQTPQRRNWAAVSQEIGIVAANAPDDPWVPMIQVSMLANTDRMAEAEALLLAAREKDPNQQSFWLALVNLAQQEGDAAKALKRLEEVEEKFGDTVEVRLQKARLLAQQEGKEAVGKLAVLAGDLEKLTPAQQLQFTWQLARTCLSVGAYDEGLRYGREAARLAPNNLRLRLFMLDVARLAGNVEAAQQLAGEIAQIEGGGAVSLYADAVVDVTRYTAAVTAANTADQQNNDTQQTRTKKAQEVNAPLLADARQKLNEAAKQRDKWSEIPVLQGMIAMYQGKPDEMLHYFLLAIDLGESDPGVVIPVVQSLASEATKPGQDSAEKWLEADRIIRKVQAQQASLPTNLGLLASQVNFYRQDYDRALELARPLARTGDVQAKLWVGQVAIAMGNYDEAEENLKAAAESSPTEPVVWTALVRCQLLAQKKEDAEKTMQEALTKVAPESRLPVHVACLQMMGKTDEALAMLREAIQAPDCSPALLEMAARFFAGVSSTHNEAIPILERFANGDLASDDASKPWARRELARLVGARDYKSFNYALQLLNENLAQDPDSLEDLRLRARLLATKSVSNEEQVEAMDALLQLAQRPGGLDPECRFLLAQYYLAKNDVAKYRKEMMDVINNADASPRLPAYVDNYISALQQQGETAEAQGIAKTYHRRWPNDLTWALVEARTLADAPRPQADQVLRVVKQAVEDPKVLPADPVVKMQMAADGLRAMVKVMQDRVAELRASASNGSGDSGSQPNKKAGGQSGTDSPGAAIADRIETGINSIDQTIDQYCQTIAEQDSSRTLVVVPHMIAQGQGDDAVTRVQQHWETASPASLVEACGALLPVLDTLGREAIEKIVLAAIEKHAGSDDELVLRRLLAMHYVSRAMDDQAIEQYQKIVERSETDVLALNNLSMLLASQGKDLPKAQEYIQKAIDLVGPAVMLLDSQAMIHLASGRSKEALETMQRVVARMPDGCTAESDPVAARRWGGYYFHVALAYKANGNMPKAREAMKTSKSLGFAESDVFKAELEAYRELASQ